MKYPILFFRIKLLFYGLVLGVILGLTSPVALAQGKARVYLQSVEATADKLTIDVIAENVTKLYGAEVWLKYDPQVVKIQDVKVEQEGIQIEPGSLLPFDQGFIVANRTDEAAGVITFAQILLNPAPPVTGSGPLARITFKLLQHVPSTITVDRAQLVAVDLQTIPTETAPLSFGNNPPTQAPVMAAPAAEVASGAGGVFLSWWSIGGVIIIIGAVALCCIVLLVDSKPRTTTRMKSRTAGRTHR